MDRIMGKIYKYEVSEPTCDCWEKRGDEIVRQSKPGSNFYNSWGMTHEVWKFCPVCGDPAIVSIKEIKMP